LSQTPALLQDVSSSYDTSH